jgi:L-ribulose-5-phosphate 4-epimerase
MLKELRIQVLETARKMRNNHLVVLAGGTVCARDPDSGYVCITASGMDYDEMTWEDIAVIDMELNIIDAKKKISVATDMFLAILRARSDVHAVIHTHSIYATAFACIDREIPAMTTTQANLVGGPVPIVKGLEPGPYTTAFYERIVATMGNGYAVNLMSHGPVVVGKDLDHCLEVAITIEVTAHTVFAAESIGIPYLLNADEIEKSFQYYNVAVGQSTDTK